MIRQSKIIFGGKRFFLYQTYVVYLCCFRCEMTWLLDTEVLPFFMTWDFFNLGGKFAL